MLSAGIRLVVSSMSLRLSFPERVIGKIDQYGYPREVDIAAKSFGLNYYKISPE
jgi:hypothetical protein